MATTVVRDVRAVRDEIGSRTLVAVVVLWAVLGALIGMLRTIVRDFTRPLAPKGVPPVPVPPRVGPAKR